MLEINKIYLGDCLELIKDIDDNSIDAVITDPPYGIGFMGKEWDNFNPSKIDEAMTKDKRPHTQIASQRRSNTAGTYDLSLRGLIGFQKWVEVWATECLRVLKPGGYLLSFGGSRTYHRMACAIEDAGFKIRDMIEWIYGSGFPKSLNGTALKPAHESICMARKPLSEKTVAENVLKWGTGGINIDKCRVKGNIENDPNYRPNAKNHRRTITEGVTYMKYAKIKDGGHYLNNQDRGFHSSTGRFPANLILSYPEEEYIIKDDITDEQKEKLCIWLQQNL